MRPNKPTVKIDADLIRKIKLWVRVPGFRAGILIQQQVKRSRRSIGISPTELDHQPELLEDQD